MAKEIEAKYLDIDRNNLLRELMSHGANLAYPEILIQRRTYTLTHGRSIRVRREPDGSITCTAKSEDRSLGALSLDEYEVQVSDYNEMCAILSLLYPDVSYSDQESKRETWILDGSEVTIDTWPGIPTFVEIESPSLEELERISKLLGYNITHAVYGRASSAYERYGISYEELMSYHTLTFDHHPTIKTNYKNH